MMDPRASHTCRRGRYLRIVGVPWTTGGCKPPRDCRSQQYLASSVYRHHHTQVGFRAIVPSSSPSRSQRTSRFTPPRVCPTRVLGHRANISLPLPRGRTSAFLSRSAYRCSPPRLRTLAFPCNTRVSIILQPTTAQTPRLPITVGISLQPTRLRTLAFPCNTRVSIISCHPRSVPQTSAFLAHQGWHYLLLPLLGTGPFPLAPRAWDVFAFLSRSALSCPSFRCISARSWASFLL